MIPDHAISGAFRERTLQITKNHSLRLYSLQPVPLFKRVMGSSGDFFRNLLPFKGGPDGPWDPEEKCDDDSQSNRA